MSKNNGNILDQPVKLGTNSVDEINIHKKYGLIQLKKYDVNKILNLIGIRAQPLKFLEYNIGLNRSKFLLFKKKGISCVSCGIKGSYFSIDKQYKNSQNTPPNINLWAVDDNGDHILMTKDHIVPRSKGGWDTIFNLQTMCSRCNGIKNDKLKRLDYIKYLILKCKFLIIEKIHKNLKKISVKISKFCNNLEEYNY